MNNSNVSIKLGISLILSNSSPSLVPGKYCTCHRGSEKEFQEKLKIIEELKLEAKLELQEIIQNRIERIKNM